MRLGIVLTLWQKVGWFALKKSKNGGKIGSVRVLLVLIWIFVLLWFFRGVLRCGVRCGLLGLLCQKALSLPIRIVGI